MYYYHTQINRWAYAANTGNKFDVLTSKVPLGSEIGGSDYITGVYSLVFAPRGAVHLTAGTYNLGLRLQGKARSETASETTVHIILDYDDGPLNFTNGAAYTQDGGCCLLTSATKSYDNMNLPWTSYRTTISLSGTKYSPPISMTALQNKTALGVVMSSRQSKVFDCNFPDAFTGLVLNSDAYFMPGFAISPISSPQRTYITITSLDACVTRIA